MITAIILMQLTQGVLLYAFNKKKQREEMNKNRVEFINTLIYKKK